MHPSGAGVACAENSKEMWAITRDNDNQRQLCLKRKKKVEFHPTAWMVLHDGFPRQQPAPKKKPM